MSAQPITPSNLPVPAARRLPAVRAGRTLPMLAERMLPAVRRSMTVTAVALAAEYALRSLANGALASVVARARRRGPEVVRTVVTEIVVRERFRHR